jgi:hypothetical protein
MLLTIYWLVLVAWVDKTKECMGKKSSQLMTYVLLVPESPTAKLLYYILLILVTHKKTQPSSLLYQMKTS